MSDEEADGVGYAVGRANDFVWTKKAFELLQSGRLAASVSSDLGIQVASVIGPCPRCGHCTRSHQVLDAVRGEPLALLGADRLTGNAGYVRLVVSCTCAEMHAERPEDVAGGCGINFHVDIYVAGQ